MLRGPPVFFYYFNAFEWKLLQVTLYWTYSQSGISSVKTKQYKQKTAKFKEK